MFLLPTRDQTSTLYEAMQRLSEDLETMQTLVANAELTNFSYRECLRRRLRWVAVSLLSIERSLRTHHHSLWAELIARAVNKPSSLSPASNRRSVLRARVQAVRNLVKPVTYSAFDMVEDSRGFQWATVLAELERGIQLTRRHLGGMVDSLRLLLGHASADHLEIDVYHRLQLHRHIRPLARAMLRLAAELSASRSRRSTAGFAVTAVSKAS